MGSKHLVGEMAQPLLGLCLILCVILCSGASIGVSYDSGESTFSSPEKLVGLLKKHDIFHVILWDANPRILEALSGSGVEVSLGLSDKEVNGIGKSESHAASWLKKHLMGFLPKTLITSIVIGNGAVTDEEISALLPTMEAIHSALLALNLDKDIKVSAALSVSLIQDAYTVPRASFANDLKLVLQPLLDFVSRTGSFLVLNTNIDRDSAYKEDSLRSVVDTAINAMNSLHYPDIPIIINEQGLPSVARDNFLVPKDPMAHILAQDGSRSKISAVFVKLNSLELPVRKELKKETEEQLPSVSRQLSEKKGASNRNETSQMGNSLVGNDGTPTTIPITNPTPTIPITNPTTPITNPTTPTTTTPTTPITNPTTPITNPTTSTPTTTTSSSGWCVAKPGTPDSSLQVALDYACGLGGADCTAIQQGGTCYNPDTVQAHASYAFDSYYKKNSMAPGTCDFGGNAMVTTQDPSSGTCTYPTSSGSSSVLNTSIPNSGLGGLGPGTANSSDATSIFFCLPIFFSLVSLIVSVMAGERLWMLHI